MVQPTRSQRRLPVHADMSAAPRLSTRLGATRSVTLWKRIWNAPHYIIRVAQTWNPRKKRRLPCNDRTRVHQHICRYLRFCRQTLLRHPPPPPRKPHVCGLPLHAPCTDSLRSHCIASGPACMRRADTTDRTSAWHRYSGFDRTLHVYARTPGQQLHDRWRTEADMIRAIPHRPFVDRTASGNSHCQRPMGRCFRPRPP